MLKFCPKSGFQIAWGGPVRVADREPYRGAIASKVLELEDLGVAVVAEGIETELRLERPRTRGGAQPGYRSRVNREGA